MYTYKPIRITSKGAIVPGHGDSNGLGVFEDGTTLVAVYIHDPTQSDRIKAHVLFYLAMSASLALLLLAVNTFDGWAAIPLVILYLGVSWLLMWGLLIPDTSPRPEAEHLKSAIYLTQGPTLDIVGSRKRLLKEYPNDAQHS